MLKDTLFYAIVCESLSVFCCTDVISVQYTKKEPPNSKTVVKNLTINQRYTAKTIFLQCQFRTNSINCEFCSFADIRDSRYPTWKAIRI